MKKIFSLLIITMLISNNANASGLIWYAIGRSTKKCSCENEKKQIIKLKEQIKIKSRLEKNNGTNSRK